VTTSCVRSSAMAVCSGSCAAVGLRLGKTEGMPCCSRICGGQTWIPSGQLNLGTVAVQVREVAATVRVGKELGLPMFAAIGPWPAEYDHEHRTAISVIAKSQRPGRHEALVKHSVARKARTVASNIWRASALGSAGAIAWRVDGKKQVVASLGPLESEWYERFAKGIKNRLGERTRQDAAISPAVMSELMRRFEEDFRSLIGDAAGEQDWSKLGEAARVDLRETAEAACFCLLSYCAGLRGFEVPRVVLTYLREFIVREGNATSQVAAHVGVPLSGRFKLRSNMDQNLLLFVAAVTRTGLIRLVWVDRLTRVLDECFGLTTGWAFQDANGGRAKMSDFEENIFDKLLAIQEERPDLIAPEIDMLDAYGLARSFRRGATTQAENQGVAPADIDYIMRWKEAKTAVGRTLREVCAFITWTSVR